MSYSQVVNGPGTDQAQAGDSSGEILESLLAAKIPPAEAERIASAFAAVYATQAALLAALRAALAGRAPQQAGIDQQGKDQIDAAEADRPDEPALETDGRAAIGGDLSVGGTLLVNNLRVLNNAVVGRRIAGNAAAFRQLAVPGGLRAVAGAVNIDGALVANRPILARQGGRYAGDNSFDGRVNLNGPVVWGGRVCQPANVVTIKSLHAAGDDTLRLGTQEVRVLRDHGNGPGGALRFEYEPDTKTVLTAVTANTQSEAVNNYTLSEASGTFLTDVPTATLTVLTSVSSATTSVNNYTLSSASVNAVTQVQTTAITVITAVGFNADSCAVTSDTTTVYVVSGVSAGTFAAATYASPPDEATVITALTPGTTSVTAVAGTSTGSLQAATYASPPDSVVLIKSVTLSQATADVADVTGNIRITAAP